MTVGINELHRLPPPVRVLVGAKLHRADFLAACIRLIVAVLPDRLERRRTAVWRRGEPA
jgi:hypothetical protein